MSDLPSGSALLKRNEVLRSPADKVGLRGTLFCLSRFALLLLLASLLGSCSKKKVEMQNLKVNPDSLYTVRTLSLNTLISDSGMIRYRMIAPELLVYERPERNEWVFPKGLTLRPYDSKQSQVFIKADSAIRHPLNEEWELVGNVIVQGPEGQRLMTHRLFWIRDERRLYSNDTTNFRVQGRELRGSHFNALDDLSWYEIYDNRGVFEYDEKTVGTGSMPTPGAPTPAPSISPTASSASSTPSTPQADTLRRTEAKTRP